MSPLGYYRFPTVAGDTIVFVSEDDLWQVDRRGGTARRLTSGWGSATRPILSGDGQWLAFCGREEGDTELYVMPADGGEIRRLTYLGAGVTTVGFDDHNRIIFSTYHGQPFLSQRRLYAIGVDGGEPELLPYGTANWMSRSATGGVVLGRPTTELAHWKRYRGGTRGVLWIDQDGSGDFSRFALEDGNMVTPLWLGSRIYFVSDHEGIGNLYSMTPAGTDIKRHTDHDEYYVRNARTDGHRIVYHAGGDIFIFDPDEDTATKVAIDLKSQRRDREKKYIVASDFWNEYVLSPSGDQLVITSRGKLHRLSPFEGPVTPVGQTQGVRYRLTRWLDDEKTLLTLSDEGGEDGLEIHHWDDAGSHVTRLPGDFGLVTELQVAPDGQFAVLANERMEIWLIDLKVHTAKLITSSTYGPANGLSWSPDSHWIAYALPIEISRTAIFLYELGRDISTQITNPVLHDRQPVFDPRGQYLYFISSRTFHPVGDRLKFDHGFPKADKPYALSLNRDTRSPFLPMPHPVVAKADDEDHAEDATHIDLDGIDKRIAEFPVAETIMLQLSAAPGKVFWTTTEPDAERDGWSLEPDAHQTLHVYDLKELKADIIQEQMANFDISANGKVMAIRSHRTLRILKTGDKVEEKKAEKPGRASGLVDLRRITISVIPEAEWYQMQREAWRLMRELFWTPNMSQVDWDRVYLRYQKLIPRLTSRSEFSDIMWEMQGELGTSHAYEIGGDYRKEPAHRIGFLGAEYHWNSDLAGYDITRIVEGDVWAPDYHSPLLDPGVNIDVGDTILAIDGGPLGPGLPPGSRLVDKVKQDVTLTIRPQDGSPSRQVVVHTLARETPMHYRQWVEENRRMVHEKTQGRVGYVHIPDMGEAGFAEFHRGYLAEYDRDGLIIDVRFNGGGSVSSLILDALSRRRLGYDARRYGTAEPYQYESPAGPMVALTNEFAGSDGDIFSHSWKMLNLGPLIGTRTWGGVIGIGFRYSLVDWTITTQPEFSFWFNNVGWGVENYGTDPDIEVFDRPQDQVRGDDPQMDRALDEVMKLLEEHPPVRPPLDKRPNLMLPTLPPRR